MGHKLVLFWPETLVRSGLLFLRHFWRTPDGDCRKKKRVQMPHQGYLARWREFFKGKEAAEGVRALCMGGAYPKLPLETLMPPVMASEVGRWGKGGFFKNSACFLSCGHGAPATSRLSCPSQSLTVILPFFIACNTWSSFCFARKSAVGNS